MYGSAGTFFYIFLIASHLKHRKLKYQAEAAHNELPHLTLHHGPVKSLNSQWGIAVAHFLYHRNNVNCKYSFLKLRFFREQVLVRKITNHRSPMQTKNSQTSGRRMMPGTR